ncbi:MAG: hypothetical protein IJ703_06025 [Eubacterium sp.]|nr:hypothetical protein [Eubacterium sp.]
MGLIIFIIIFYNLIAKNNPKMQEKTKNRLPFFIVLFVLFEILRFSGAAIASGIGVLLALGMVASPFIFIAWVINKARSIGKRNESKEYNKIKEEIKEDIKLTESVPKRRKIVAKFNEKYSLCLTDSQIDRIVEASYYSYSWLREIYDMDKTYKFASQWIEETNDWLRTYLYVFPVMDISTDFARQEQIVEDTYYAIFREIDPKSCFSVEECIEKINNKYMTRFDEKTFMEAYRFLQKHHHNFKLPGADRTILRNESEVDRLAEKYSGFSSKKQKQTVDREYSKPADDIPYVQAEYVYEPGSSGESASGSYVDSMMKGDRDITPEEVEELIRSGKISDAEIMEMIRRIYGSPDEDDDEDGDDDDTPQRTVGY